ncbi:TPA: translational GTPase TypA [Candidatus Saccharibacteria bacterium]|nr:MAG: GTP-binding protein [Candidatus Saccharibacteria bacterium GW2011_GWC2_44_17]MBH1956056.1 translational GTPase TypA [Candidatus Saccharibacteria bacterium]OGL23645.1 MAG: GTP-binding protein TypA [Candidatus Saccharibacteria bacterium RIFCSPHIGHO2_01_FULL_46_30]OGL33354.1 MAG: GTP-binding protein TypA [Candidatus Saccharibacteria bacterium RIFCSPHIGHO2_12_FULL_47_16]MBH1972444.1 translational GTPase TypA [Candidatus Saccharibacteria bacterium]
MKDPKFIRNIAIIAHVDHGKTTMVDGLLKQSNTFRDNQAEMNQDLIMDSGDQEHERGITITAKQTSIYHDDYKINIIDTPGHADFSGEVERTLNMADGVLLVVDAQEGPMPQTKFVLSKALELGLKPVVIINKIDKPSRRIDEVIDEVSDLFLELAIEDSQLHYPVYYAIGRDGKAWKELPENPAEHTDLSPIFDAIINDIPAPTVEVDKPFQLLVTSLQYDNFLGKYAIGRITRGDIKKAQQVVLIKRDGTQLNAKIDKIFGYRGLNREEIDAASAGDIVALTGIADAHIGETIADKENPEALPVIDIEAPTLSMYLGPNTSPMKGKEAEFNTSRQIGDRLKKEIETNVSLRVEDDGIGFTVSGRGELHLSVLIETLRREGFEFEVGRPQVVTIEEDGELKEPVEELLIEVAAEFLGAVSQELGTRRAALVKQEQTSSGTTRTTYILPTRAMIGLRNLLLTATKGTVIINSLPHGYQPIGPKLQQTRNGALIATEAGSTTAYALDNSASRGELFVGPGTTVYQGMIVGVYNRQGDLDVNVCRGKQLTNMRTSSSDGTVQLTPFTDLSLEQSIDFIEDDELLEVTPKSLRLRKRFLDPNQRKRNSKK